MGQQQQKWSLSSDILFDEDHNSSNPWLLKHQAKTTEAIKTPLSTTTLMSTVDSEKRSSSMDELVSSMDDLADLQGSTLVPNSPYLSCPNSPELAKVKQLLEDEEHDRDAINSESDNDIDERGSPMACIFVASLNNTMTDEELNLSVHSYFLKWGNLINVKVFKDWMNRPYAFVQFERISQAQKALNESPGTVLDGRSIRCEQARVNRTLYLSSSSCLVENDIHDELSFYGQIEDICVDKDKDTCAYVKFRYRDDAIKAFLDIQKPSFSKQWKASWCSNIKPALANKDTANYDKSCIYIGNLDKDIVQSQLYTRFQAYGHIRTCNIIQKPHTHMNVTFGFVKYATRDAATRAIHTENGLLWNGHVLKVSYREVNKFRQKWNRNFVPQPMLPFPSPSTMYPRPHPPGLGMSASDAITAAAATAVGYDSPGYINNCYYQTTAVANESGGSPSQQDQSVECGQVRTPDQEGTLVEATGTRYTGAPQALYGTYSPGNAGLEAYHHLNSTSGPHYWYPTQHHSSSYYQMYPHAGIYYYARVPCMDPLNTTATTYLQPMMMVPTYQPIQYSMTTIRDASNNNTCDLASDDK